MLMCKVCISNAKMLKMDWGPNELDIHIQPEEEAQLDSTELSS